MLKGREREGIGQGEREMIYYIKGSFFHNNAREMGLVLQQQGPFILLSASSVEYQAEGESLHVHYHREGS